MRSGDAVAELGEESDAPRGLTPTAAAAALPCARGGVCGGVRGSLLLLALTPLVASPSTPEAAVAVAVAVAVALALGRAPRFAGLVAVDGVADEDEGESTRA